MCYKLSFETWVLHGFTEIPFSVKITPKVNLFSYIFTCVCNSGLTCAIAHMWKSGQVCGLSSLLPPLYAFHSLSSGHQACAASILPSEPLCWPQVVVVWKGSVSWAPSPGIIRLLRGRGAELPSVVCSAQLHAALHSYKLAQTRP